MNDIKIKINGVIRSQLEIRRHIRMIDQIKMCAGNAPMNQIMNQMETVKKAIEEASKASSMRMRNMAEEASKALSMRNMAEEANKALSMRNMAEEVSKALSMRDEVEEASKALSMRDEVEEASKALSINIAAEEASKAYWKYMHKPLAALGGVSLGSAIRYKPLALGVGLESAMSDKHFKPLAALGGVSLGSAIRYKPLALGVGLESAMSDKHFKPLAALGGVSLGSAMRYKPLALEVGLESAMSDKHFKPLAALGGVSLGSAIRYKPLGSAWIESQKFLSKSLIESQIYIQNPDPLMSSLSTNNDAVLISDKNIGVCGINKGNEYTTVVTVVVTAVGLFVIEHIVLPYFVATLANLSTPIYIEWLERYFDTGNQSERYELYNSTNLENFWFVTATSLNVRGLGDMTSEIIDKLSFGMIVKVFKESESKKWSFIEYQDAESGNIKKGWVYSKYLYKFNHANQ